MTSKNGSIGRLFVTPLLSEIAKKLGKMLKYNHYFQSAFGTAALVDYRFIPFVQRKIDKF